MSGSRLVGRKRVLLVLFIPSVERDGRTPVEQDRWTMAALELFGRIYGGATAYPKARGVWRDDGREGTLVFDEPVVLHSYVTARDAAARAKLKRLGAFCRRMGRETRQGEIGLVIADEYVAIRDFEEPRP